MKPRRVASTCQALGILTRNECDRCHAVEASRPFPAARGCGGCHEEISSSADEPERLARGRQTYGDAFDSFVQRTAARYSHVPALASMERFRAGWLRSYLASPYDLRPSMVESMFRPNLDDAELDTLLAGWGVEPDGAEPGPPTAEQLERGQALFADKSCGMCHLFGNRPLKVAAGWQFDQLPTLAPRALAPDLQHARHRLTRATIARWIQNPASVKPTAAMPRLPVSPAEAEALADFVYFADLGPTAKSAARRPPPYDPAAGVPRFEEVAAKVFEPVCRHCHGSARLGAEDRGPGFSGGFGFVPPGLSFASFDDVVRSAAFREGASGEPVILERLRARYRENDRDCVLPGTDPLTDRRGVASTAPRGMPLGLPALTGEQFSLVERWVRGGHPGPAAP